MDPGIFCFCLVFSSSFNYQGFFLDTDRWLLYDSQSVKGVALTPEVLFFAGENDPDQPVVRLLRADADGKTAQGDGAVLS